MPMYIPGQKNKFFNDVMDVFEDKHHSRHAKIVQEGLSGQLYEAKRSKAKAVEKIMDDIKDSLVKFGFKHKQLGSVDTYEKEASENIESEIKKLVPILKKFDIFGFHNKEESDYQIVWNFGSKAFRGLNVTITFHKDNNVVTVNVYDSAMG